MRCVEATGQGVSSIAVPMPPTDRAPAASPSSSASATSYGSRAGAREIGALLPSVPRVVEFSARHMFDGKRQMAADAGEDPFRLLPDDVLRHVLSFLPEDEALQTCVLNTGWRDFWRRATSLYIDFYACRSDIEKYERLKQAANLMIHLRGNSPLVNCEIGCLRGKKDAEALIEYALMCQVEDLTVLCNSGPDLPRYDAPFISQHLKILEFCDLTFEGSSLDFSNCPVLEDLTIEHCCINAPSILSKSLKRLCISRHTTFSRKFHISIVAPDLISLQLDGFKGLTPSLGYMPFLVSAYVGLGFGCHDFCTRNGQSCDDHECGCHAYPVDKGLLLNGLSNAVSLELLAKPKMFIYRWDLEWCPIFGKLKTLLLNDWFTTIDLVCILQHCPILEMLTLQLDKTENLVTAKGSQKTIELPFVCAHLKVVNIECVKVDEGVRKILKILSTGGIPRERISIKDTCFDLYCFSFRKPPHYFYCRHTCSSSQHH